MKATIAACSFALVMTLAGYRLGISPYQWGALLVTIEVLVAGYATGVRQQRERP